MKNLFTLLSLLIVSSSHLCAEESVTRSKTLTPEDLGIRKWDIVHKTTKTTTFVMRFQHYLNGKLLWDYEEFYYQPKKPKIGTLLVFSRPEPIIYLPTSNRFSFSVCKHILTNETTTKLKCIDGLIREANTIEVKGSDYYKNAEKVLIHFYEAPMKIFTDKIKDAPVPANNNSFRWLHKISPMITVDAKVVDGKMKLDYTDWSKIKESQLQDKSQ